MSQLLGDFPQIVELDVNPLKVLDEGQGSVAVDARLVLRQDDSGEPCFQPLRSRTGQISSVPKPAVSATAPQPRG